MISKYFKTKANLQIWSYISNLDIGARLLIGTARNDFDFPFTQLLGEDYCLRHNQNKTACKPFDKLAKNILGSFSSNYSKSSHFTSTLIQVNEQYVVIVHLIYLSQNKTTIQKSSDCATLNLLNKMLVWLLNDTPKNITDPRLIKQHGGSITRILYIRMAK